MTAKLLLSLGLAGLLSVASAWFITMMLHLVAAARRTRPEKTTQVATAEVLTTDSLATVGREIIAIAASQQRPMSDVVRDTVQQVSINIEGVQELAREQVRFPGLGEVWVLARRPVDLEEDFYSSVLHNVKDRFVKYYYFVTDTAFFKQLKARLTKDIGDSDYVNRQVFCVEVEPIVFIATPGLAIWLTDQGRPIKGKTITALDEEGRITEARDMTTSQMHTAYFNMRPLVENAFGRSLPRIAGEVGDNESSSTVTALRRVK